MKYGRTILALAALSVAACANDKAPKSTTTSAPKLDVIGTYRNDDSTMNYEELLTIDANSVTLSLLCNNGGKKARVEVKAPARVTDSVIEILQTVQKTEMSAGNECVAKLDKELLPYSINKFKDLFITPANQLGKRYTKLGVEMGFWARRWEDIKEIDGRMKSDVGAAVTDFQATMTKEGGETVTEADTGVSSTVGTAVTTLKDGAKAALGKAGEVVAKHPPSLESIN